MATLAELDAAIAKKAKLAKIDSLLGQAQQQPAAVPQQVPTDAGAQPEVLQASILARRRYSSIRLPLFFLYGLLL